jgi:hypothetical protein
VDVVARAREIGRAHAAFLAGRRTTTGSAALREVVARSWLRAARARVDPDGAAPVLLSDDELAAYRAGHPLSAVIGVLRELVAGTADDGEHLMAVSDEAGRLLWVEGHRDARRRAEAMNFVEGAAWDEPHAGTNAPGTALALDRPVQIVATEHFRHAVQGWTCSAAPIHDPPTGRLLGVVDVTGGDAVAHPYSLALVTAAARAAEGALHFGRDPTSGVWLPRQQEPARLAVLGRGDALLAQDGQEIRLNRRQSEVVFLLATHPEGMSGEQLAADLYPADSGESGAVRVELSRLRRVVGDLVASRPYRLTRPVSADYLDVTAALRRGDLATALAGYAGPLLPSSEAPAVVAQRRWLDLQLRAAVLASGDPDVVSRWAERLGFDDLQVWERLLALTPPGLPLHAVAAARVRQLRREYGLADLRPRPVLR